MPAAAQFSKVCDILDRYGRDAAKLIPILQAVQAEYRYLPEEILTFVAVSLDLPPARVYGVATFYSHFTLTPKGRHVVRLCDGTACHVRGSMPILDALRKRLGLEAGRDTTPDLMFTVETVSCLGACGLAPVMVVDDEVHGQVTPESAVAVLENLIAEEA
jgi:NADH-quinone oxidoreductase subunit E